MGVLSPRRLRAIRVPVDQRVLELLPAIADAQSGTGPALVPLGEGDPRADRIAQLLGAEWGPEYALGTSAELGSDEDDPTDPTALVIATSGSTGTPKGVLLSTGQLAASAAATEQRLGGPGSWLLALPAYHIAGMQVLLRAAKAGTEPTVLSGDKPFTAEAFVAAARHLHGERRYVSLVPTQLQRIVDDPSAAGVTAEVFDAVLVGGSAIPAPLLRQARDAGIPVVTTYGMSETCGGCVYDGVPLAGVRARLTGRGAIVLTGPMVARGYRGRPDGANFIAMPRRAGASPIRSFVTSDTGEIDAEGRLFVHGRLDDVIITGGVKVAPAAVEAALRELPEIGDALVVGVPDAQWGQAVAALVVPGSTGDAAGGLDVAAVRTALEAVGSLPRTHYPTRMQVVAAIPQLPSGKPDRTAARRLLQL